MSAEERTLTKVTQEFINEKLSVLNEMRQKYFELVDQEMRNTSKQVDSILDNARKQAESLRRQILGGAEVEARNKRLLIIEQAIKEVIETALKTISSMNKKEYSDLVSRLVNEALEITGKDSVVYCNEKDREIVSSILKGRASLAGKSIETIGGVISESRDGSVRYDNTIEARLERIRQQLRKEISNILTS